uniref:Hypotherical protein n=1 Tax=Schistosoma japonicum TaxID=6182 RepID=C1LF60_SCHJA|nr:hypotherical protein [Schistosoma japonicum]
MGSEIKSERVYIPSDRYNLVYVIFFMCGLGGLLPWNFFINAQRYFDYKMRNKTLPEDADFTDPMYKTHSQVLFGSYLAVCSLVPFSLMMVANLLLTKRFSSFSRFVVGSVLVFLMFLVTVILVYIDVSANTFLIITLCSVVLLNCGSALSQGSVFGTVAVLPYKHMKAALEGQAVSGVLASLANIISIATSSSPTVNGLVYFLVALCFITITAALFLVLPRNDYFAYYWSKKNNQDETKEPSLEGMNNERGNSLEPIVSENKIGVLSSMRETFLPGMCVLITLMITLSLFPAIAARIRPITIIPNDPWTNVYFVPVLIFLLYNVGDWCGRTLAGFVKWPKRNRMLLVLFLCLLRAASIPVCMLCNAQPRSYLPVVFKHDIFPALIILILGLTNGYLVSISMIHGPTFASPGNQESAGAALSIYLSFGLSFGVAISVGLSQIL